MKTEEHFHHKTEKGEKKEILAALLAMSSVANS